MQNRAKLDERLTLPLELMTNAKRPSTPSPPGHESTKKLRTGITSLPTPDSRDRISTGKKRAAQLESLQTPDVSPCPKRFREAMLGHKKEANISAKSLGLPHSEGRGAGLITNEERSPVIRMTEEDYPVQGVTPDQMEIFFYVTGKLRDAFGRRA